MQVWPSSLIRLSRLRLPVRATFFWLLAVTTVPLGAVPSLTGSGSGSGKTPGDTPEPADPGLAAIVESGVDLLLSKFESDPEDGPSWQSFESPRHTVLTFMEAMGAVRKGHTEAWERALQALPDAGEEASGSGDGRRTGARKLHDVLLRLGDLEPIALPGPEAVRRENLRRFELFPFGMDHTWVWEALDQAPQGAVALRRGEDDAWHFTRETMEGVAALLDSIESLPPRYEEPTGQVFLEAVDPARQAALWRWIGLLGMIAAGLALGFFVRRQGRKAGHRVESRHFYLGNLLLTMSGPLALAVFLVALAVGLALIPLSPVLEQVRGALVRGLLLFLVGFLLFRLVDFGAAALQHLAGRRGSAYDATAMALLRRTLRTITLVVVALFLLENFGGLNIGSLLAGLGILGLGLSLAGQGVFKNALGAFNIFINEPFLIGDWIRFEDHLGSVEDVGLYATKVRLLSGELLTVPNMRFIDEEVENLSERQYLRREMNVAIPYDTPVEKVEEAMSRLEEVLTADPVAEEGHFQLEQRPPKISFSHYGSYFLNLRVYYWYFMGQGQTRQRDVERGWFSYLEHSSEVNLQIKRAFEESGIEFAFPTQTQVLTDDPVRGLQVGREAQPS